MRLLWGIIKISIALCLTWWLYTQAISAFELEQVRLLRGSVYVTGMAANFVGAGYLLLALCILLFTLGLEKEKPIGQESFGFKVLFFGFAVFYLIAVVIAVYDGF